MGFADLTDGGLLLRVPRDDDLQEIVAACQDPEMSRWTRLPFPYGDEAGRAFLAMQEQRRTAGTDLVVLAFEVGAERPFVGEMGLHNIAHGDAGIGYWTAPWARERGLTTQALRLFTRWAFDTLQLERIEWAAMVGNPASRRVAEKAGFRVSGTMRHVLASSAGRSDMWVGDLLSDDLSVGTETSQERP